jgi:hypothetical protein
MSIFTSKGFFFETFFLEDNVSNIFGRIVPKSGEFTMEKWREIAVCRMGLIGRSLNPEADTYPC